MSSSNDTGMNGIHRLPLEILIAILDLSVKPDGPLSEPRLPRLQSLSAVCQFWKDIIDNTAPLWATIVVDRGDHLSSNLLVKALETSSPSPLDIRITLYGETPYDMRSLILPHIDRVCSLRLTLYSAAGWTELLTRAAPSMEVVDINVLLGRYEARPEATLEVMFGGTATLLRVLRLHNIQIQIGRPLGLKELHVTGASFNGSTLQDIGCILRGSPGLEELVLDETALRGAVHLSDEETVHLLHLKKLKLDGLPEDVAGYLINLIDAPHLESFSYTSESDNTPPSPPVTNMLLQSRKALDRVSNPPSFVLIRVRNGPAPFWCIVERSESEIGGSDKVFDVALRLCPTALRVLLQPIVSVVLSHLQSVV